MGARIDSSTFREEYKHTASVQSLLLLLRLVLNRKQTVNIEGLLVGNRYTVNGKPPSSPKNARTVLQP